jgi:hypothetical protein
VAVVDHAGDEPVGGLLPREVLRVVTPGPAANQTAPSARAAQKKATSHSHADLVGQRFVDHEDRELTVTGPDPLFPATHVRVEREGKHYGIPAERVRGYLPVSQSGEGPPAEGDRGDEAPAAPAPSPARPKEGHELRQLRFDEPYQLALFPL